jgi:hypothetical protein
MRKAPPTFTELCEREFRFLVDEFGFGEPEQEAGRSYLAVAYRTDKIGIRVEFEEREQAIWVVLTPLEHGEWPDRFRSRFVYLERLAELRGARLPSGGRRYPLSPDALRHEVHTQATLLASIARDVLRGDVRILDELILSQNEQRRRS